MIDFKDMDSLDGGNSERTTNEEIRKNAHMVNGGEQSFSCKACNGRGKFVSYSGRIVGDCFKCKGKGRVTARQLSAQRGVQTRKENDAKWQQENADVIAYARRAADGGFRVMGRMIEKLEENGRWSAADLAYVAKFKQQDDDRNAARAAARAEEEQKRKDNAQTVELSAIAALFATAIDNQIKRPIFRAETLELSRASEHSKNAGALYVTRRDEEGTYLGMLKDGKFIARREATQADVDALLAIAADPTAESIKYARRTGRCGCCGKQLVNPVSILAAIGPICASKWGLDFRRELAATEYANMKAEEIKRIKE
jgi:hypothetical protein